MVDLLQIRATLEAQIAGQQDLPCHVAAFIDWLSSDTKKLRKRMDGVIALSDQARKPEHVAALGFGAAIRLLSENDTTLFSAAITHLRGRKFFVPGRPLRFEIDGIALLGVALGVATCDDLDMQNWLTGLLAQASGAVARDDWQLGLIHAARRCCSRETSLKIIPEDLVLALAARGLIEPDANDLKEGWTQASSLKPHQCGPARDAIRLAAFDYILARQGQITFGAMNRESLVQLLQGMSRSMKFWSYEDKPRTPKSAIAQWEIENEYHVQNLLWTVLAPVFPDLQNEVNLPSIGHKTPRADLCVPSLRTIIEVKFMRNKGQEACRKIIDEISTDTGLYLSKTTDYDNIVCFVWDDSAQTEQYDTLKAGLEALKGILAAVILPRPSKMTRPSS